MQTCVNYIVLKFFIVTMSNYNDRFDDRVSFREIAPWYFVAEWFSQYSKKYYETKSCFMSLE